jgi:hypothetical protein
MKTISAIVGVIILFVGLIWAIQGNDFFMYKFFFPKYEGVRRQVFEQTKSYNQGMIQELQNMQFQYEQADAEHKKALASIILHRAADYDTPILQERAPELYLFIQRLKQDQARSY